MLQAFFDLFDRLVPESGQADTEQGELIRAINKLADDFVSNGFANWDAGYERLSAFALRFLADGTFGPQTTTGIRTDIEHIGKYGRGQGAGGYDLDAAFARLMQASVEWCKRHPTAIPHRSDPDLKR